MSSATVLLAATQRIGPYDAYDAGSLVLALAAGLALAVRLLLAGPGDRGLRGRPVNELLAFLVLVSLTVLGVHQLVTDDLCHGACSLSQLPSSR